MFNHTRNNNLNYLTDPTFIKANRLLVLTFQNIDDGKWFWRYYKPNVEIKDFNVLADEESFSDTPIKNFKKAYERIIEIERMKEWLVES